MIRQIFSELHRNACISSLESVWCHCLLLTKIGTCGNIWIKSPISDFLKIRFHILELLRVERQKEREREGGFDETKGHILRFFVSVAMKTSQFPFLFATELKKKMRSHFYSIPENMYISDAPIATCKAVCINVLSQRHFTTEGWVRRSFQSCRCVQCLLGHKPGFSFALKS
jgi:hypothetical protein